MSLSRQLRLPTRAEMVSFLPSIPILGWIRGYQVGWIVDDVIAGLTVGMMLVPQGIAYASGIAMLAPEYGLYASFMGLFIYAILGTSKVL